MPVDIALTGVGDTVVAVWRGRPGRRVVFRRWTPTGRWRPRVPGFPASLKLGGNRPPTFLHPFPTRDSWPYDGRLLDVVDPGTIRLQTAGQPALGPGSWLISTDPIARLRQPRLRRCASIPESSVLASPTIWVSGERHICNRETGVRWFFAPSAVTEHSQTGVSYPQARRALGDLLQFEYYTGQNEHVWFDMTQTPPRPVAFEYPYALGPQACGGFGPDVDLRYTAGVYGVFAPLDAEASPGWPHLALGAGFLVIPDPRGRTFQIYDNTGWHTHELRVAPDGGGLDRVMRVTTTDVTWTAPNGERRTTTPEPVAERWPSPAPGC